MKGQRQSREKIAFYANQIREQLDCQSIIVGSYRREQRGIGDIDIIAIDPPVKFTKKSYSLAGIQVDIRSCRPSQIGSMLLYFTGSKWHNIKLRSYVQSLNWQLNEYGLWSKSDKLIHSETESGIYLALGLHWIHPVDRSMNKFSKFPFDICGQLCPHCQEPCIRKLNHTIGRHETTPKKLNVLGHSWNS